MGPEAKFLPGDVVVHNGIHYVVDAYRAGTYRTYMTISRDYTSREGDPTGECVDISDPSTVKLVRRY